MPPTSPVNSIYVYIWNLINSSFWLAWRNNSVSSVLWWEGVGPVWLWWMWLCECCPIYPHQNTRWCLDSNYRFCQSFAWGSWIRQAQYPHGNMRFNWVELFLNFSREINYENNTTFIIIEKFRNIGRGQKLAQMALEAILRCALIENKVRIATKFGKELTGNILTVTVTYTHALIKQNCDTIGLVKPNTKTL